MSCFCLITGHCGGWDLQAGDQEVLQRDPENVGGHYNLGVALMGLKRWDEAIRHFSEVVRLKPELEDARQNLRICLQQKANRDKDANN